MIVRIPLRLALPSALDAFLRRTPLPRPQLRRAGGTLLNRQPHVHRA
jgi:hypothetical protein